MRDAIAGMGLDALAVNSAALLAPWQQMEQTASTREEHDLGDIANEVAETREFIASRPAEVAEWLGEQPSAQTPGPTSTDPAHRIVVDFPKKSSLKVGRAWVKRGVVRTEAHPWSSGVLLQRVVFPARKGPVVACQDKLRVKRAGERTLSCRLPAAVRERLRREGLGLTVVVRFLPAVGHPESVTRRILLPRG